MRLIVHIHVLSVLRVNQCLPDHFTLIPVFRRLTHTAITLLVSLVNCRRMHTVPYRYQEQGPIGICMRSIYKQSFKGITEKT